MDLLLFKLAFHTYEALSNKARLKQRKGKTGSDGGGIFDPNDDVDLISNMSDESVMTNTGSEQSAREKRYQKHEENTDILLNRYLMKWIVIIIFYQTTYIWSIMSWFLPAIPAIKLGLGFWIMLPQNKGEFFIYHLLLEYILQVEQRLLSIRCDLSSLMVKFFTSLAVGSLKFAVTYVSEDSILQA